MAKTRLFFVTDVHGSDRCFRKFINAGKFYNAGVLVLGGDITGKMIVPIVKQPDGTSKAEFGGTEYDLKSQDQVNETVKTIQGLRVLSVLDRAQGGGGALRRSPSS